MKRILSIILFFLSFSYLNVNAFSSSAVGTSYIEAGETFTVSLNLANTIDLTAFDCILTYDTSKLELVSTSGGPGWTATAAAKVAAFNATGANGNTTVAILTFKAKSAFTSGSTVISFTNLKGSNSSIEKQTGNDTSLIVNVVNNDLASLTLSNGTLSPAFNKNTTSYNVTINAASVTISASPEVGSSTVSGTGEKTLNYGNNTFEVTVKSLNNKTKTYTITINRPDSRSNDATLKSLTVTNTSIKFNGNTSYSYTVDNSVTSIKISASSNNNKATITGIGTLNLSVGQNVFNVVVTAENGTKNTYTITINRKGNKTDNNTQSPKDETKKSSDNYLSKLNICGEDISLSKNNLKYTVKLNNSIDNATFTYTSSSNKANVALEGDTRLNVGNNEFKIVVTAEDGKKRTYEITVIRLENTEEDVKEETPEVIEQPVEESKKSAQTVNIMKYLFIGTLGMSLGVIITTFIVYRKRNY